MGLFPVSQCTRRLVWVCFLCLSVPEGYNEPASCVSVYLQVRMGLFPVSQCTCRLGWACFLCLSVPAG